MGYKLTSAEKTLMEPGTCTVCGIDSPPGRNSAGMCGSCHNRNYHATQAERKAARATQLAAEPRCMVDGCSKRGGWSIPGGIVMCKSHVDAAYRKSAGLGVYSLFLSPSDFLHIAGEAN